MAIKKQNITLKELTTLSVGDYVTHIDHGIGRFGGLQKFKSKTKHRKLLNCVYADNCVREYSFTTQNFKIQR
jgi:transcription-repair coupling factor (superfamily II helicase)